MATLSKRDAEQLLRFVGDAERIGDDEPFTGDVLVELGRLIEADRVTYTEVDHIRRRSLVYLPRPGDEATTSVIEDDGGDDVDLQWDLMGEHPVCQRWGKEGRFSALRLSDVSTQRELSRNRFYAAYFVPWGIAHELKARLPSPSWHAKTFMFSRKRGRDFTKRDREALELLRPHLIRLWEAARTRRLLRSALEALESAPESDARGVVLVGPRGELDFVSAPARRLLRRAFPETSAQALPAPLADWLETKTAEPFVGAAETGKVTVRRAGEGALMLEEQPRHLGLTRREREVLGWVARGKTNAQVAELLWLSPGTVRKHLENVYTKLGVTTRTAAVARFLGLIDAQAS